MSEFEDDAFHFDEAPRARIAAQFDSDALELEVHRYSFANPALNALYADVWRPYWDSQPGAALDDESSHIPGRVWALGAGVHARRLT